MITIDPKKDKTTLVQKYLLGAVAPRPIALVSTIDKEGIPNLSPFSFFNAFSASPPIVAFSPARRIRDNTTKHTLDNAEETKEVVISVVNYDIVNQVSLSSADFPNKINEFEKAGLTPIRSEIVAPFMVKESPVNFECKVLDIIPFGSEGGSGNLVLCEILLIHIHPEVLDEENMIDPLKIDLVSRLGGIWYGRTKENSLFKVHRPAHQIVIGIDNLPDHIKKSSVLSGSDLALLANIESIPKHDKADTLAQFSEVRAITDRSLAEDEERKLLHTIAKEMLAEEKIEEAWKILLID